MDIVFLVVPVDNVDKTILLPRNIAISRKVIHMPIVENVWIDVDNSLSSSGRRDFFGQIVDRKDNWPNFYTALRTQIYGLWQLPPEQLKVLPAGFCEIPGIDIVGIQTELRRQEERRGWRPIVRHAAIDRHSRRSDGLANVLI
jgi:hypothetical protein